MNGEFQVQKAPLTGENWITVCRGSEAQAREVFLRQLRLYSIGRFRLLNPEGGVVEERRAQPLFCQRWDSSGRGVCHHMVAGFAATFCTAEPTMLPDAPLPERELAAFP